VRQISGTLSGGGAFEGLDQWSVVNGFDGFSLNNQKKRPEKFTKEFFLSLQYA
jgi:hypothetical protein